jgi:transposase-like protein
MTKGFDYTIEVTSPPVCPDCKCPMGKAGGNWSGSKKMQKWRCHGCGKTKTKGDYQPRVKRAKGDK